MDKIGVGHPNGLNFSVPASWPQWKKRFERYMSVSGFNSKTDAEKIDLLLYTMGEEAEEILLQFESGQTSYGKVLENFDNHFIPKRNIIFERFKFNSRVQKPGESIDYFITSLHALAEHCNYGTLKGELIRDRIVVGITDVKLSERLQLQNNLTLPDAIFAAKQAELQNSQNQLIRQEKMQSVGAVKHIQRNKHNSRIREEMEEEGKASTSRGRSKCKYSGRWNCKWGNCPARESSCRMCRKKGHWASVCRENKNIHSLNWEEEEESEVEQEEVKTNHYLGQIYSNKTGQWVIDLVVANKFDMSFLVDSGADVACMPYKRLPVEYRSFIETCKESIGGPDSSKLNVVGKIRLDLRYKQDTTNEYVYLIQNLRLPILGRVGITRLNIMNFPHSKVFNINEQRLGPSQFCIEGISLKFPGIFDDIGEFKNEMTINIKQDAKPFIQSVPRTVPLPLLSKLKLELERLLRLNIIEQIDVHTEWVSPIVCVPKGNTVRLCCDYTRLNQSVMRAHYPLPKIEHTLAQLRGSKYFSKLDTTSGFYQIKLTKESQLLTTFITPFGRYYFKRLPFGISCAPEYFTMNFSKILTGIEGIVFHMDDILIHAETIEKHDEILNIVLTKLHSEGITLNKNKCIIGSSSVKYLGHIITSNGIEIVPERVRAIREFPIPENKTQLLRVLGMIHFAGKYVKNKSEILEPLTALLSRNVEFLWGPSQEKAFTLIKNCLEQAPNLALFDYNKTIIVSSDASSYGLGGCLIQVAKDNKREMVEFASRLLTPVEIRYAQIEKEALAVTCAAEKFSEYITGVNDLIFEVDHKSLLQILQTKSLDDLTPRLQRFRMRLMRYKYRIIYTPGKELTIPDTLSRAPVKNSVPNNEELTDTDVDAYVHSIIKHLPVKDYFLKQIIKEQNNDLVLQKIKQYSLTEWPDKSKLPIEILPYYQYKHDISFSEGLILKSSRIIIPMNLQLKCLEFVHTGHLGIVKCRERAKMCIWWIGLSSQLENLIKNCPECIENRINIKETFHKDERPIRPWQKIAVDLFKLDKWFLIVVDYYSRFFEIFDISSMNEDNIISKLKELFARYGIPEIVRSDNGPQFSRKFQKFANE